MLYKVSEGEVCCRKEDNPECQLLGFEEIGIGWLLQFFYETLKNTKIVLSVMLCPRKLTSLAGDRMKIRPKRHHRSTANPVKNLQQRNDVRTETEVKYWHMYLALLTFEFSVVQW